MRDESKVTYLNILIDSLKKKENLLLKLKTETLKQEEIIGQQEFNADRFDETLNAKQAYIEELLKTDEGFMEIYEKIKDDLKTNASDYRSEIETAKALIKKQTEMSIELQTLESKNQTGLQIHLSKGKQKVRDFNANSKTVAAYYKNMTNHHQEGDSYFFNREK